MSKKHFLRGLRDGIPIGLGYFAVSFGIGISAHNAHLSIFQGFLLSFLNNASSGEYGGITIIAADSGLWAMALMMLVVNARYLLMSCALSQRLSPDTPLPWRLLIAYDLTDEIFGLAIAQPGYLEVWYYFNHPCARRVSTIIRLKTAEVKRNCITSVKKLTMKLGKSAKEEKSAERIKNFSCNLTQSVVISYMAFLEKHIWIGKR